MRREDKMRTYFKVFEEGDIIALFPDRMADLKGNILSYQHLGQHSGASPELISLPDATEAERNDLERELVGIGYELDIVEA